MSKISSEFILGSAIGYFFSNNLLVFTLGVATGVFIQEKFGSVYKFTEFCLDSSKEFVIQKAKELKTKFSGNSLNKLSLEENLSNITNEQINNNIENESDDNCIKNKEE